MTISETEFDQAAADAEVESVQFDMDDVEDVVSAMKQIHSHRQYISSVVTTLKDDKKNVKIFKKVCKAEFDKSFPKIKAENDLFDIAVQHLGV